ncbi:uncharacterized protein LOC111266621 [Varroa jacobsoni]|uniref:uncharacterized protein LOC111266621 n=1 Tax=Varroa jacobsoni TaxID=62625 RepID=UPI000BF53F52|nr:uncharacterized protein LOC111266621 [Varroa jacobsoni]
MFPFLCLFLYALLRETFAGHSHIGVGIYDRDPHDQRDHGSGLSDPYGRNEYDYGYSRGRIAYENDYHMNYRQGARYGRRSSSRIDRSDRYDRDRVYDRFYDRVYGRDGSRPDRIVSVLRPDGYNKDGYNRNYNRYNRGYKPDRGYGYDRYGQDYYLRDFQRDFTKDRQSVARLADVNRVPDRLYDIYDRYAAYDRYQPRGYYNDHYPRNGPGTFFGQTRYPAEGRYDRGYGRPITGRIEGYEVRNYGWKLGNGRNVLNTEYDHGFTGSYQRGYGTAYYTRPVNYIAGVASRLYS